MKKLINIITVFIVFVVLVVCSSISYANTSTIVGLPANLTAAINTNVSTAFTVSAVSDPLKVSFLRISPWGGVFTSYTAEISAMTKADIHAGLGLPWRQYGYCDIWNGADQIYIVYYNINQVPVTIVILPVTSW